MINGLAINIKNNHTSMYIVQIMNIVKLFDWKSIYDVLLVELKTLIIKQNYI